MKRDLERHLRIQPLLKNKNSLDIRIKATTKEHGGCRTPASAESKFSIHRPITLSTGYVVKYVTVLSPELTFRKQSKRWL